MARRIDPHVHFWVPGINDLAWMSNDIKPVLYHSFLPQDAKQHIDQHNIEGIIKVQAGCTLEDNVWWLQLADEHP